jgi:hypothetical protein
MLQNLQTEISVNTSVNPTEITKQNSCGCIIHSHSVPRLRSMELYFHSAMHICGVVLSAGAALPLSSPYKTSKACIQVKSHVNYKL